MKVKKFFCVLGLLTFASLQATYAQQDDQTTKSVQALDSLKQMVNDLSVKSQKIEAEALDKRIWRDRAKYFNIGYASQSLTYGQDKRKSDIGISLNWGRTYYLHKKPILGMIKVGLDWTWLDVDYVKYKEPTDVWGSKESYTRGYDGYYYDDDYDGEEDDKLDLGVHQFDFGMQFGPSITINPIDQLKISTYFHFTPSFSGIILNNDFYSSYVSYFTFGGAVSYKIISLGMEGRWGKAKYGNAGLSDVIFDEDEVEMGKSSPSKFKISSFRVYVSFRY